MKKKRQFFHALSKLTNVNRILRVCFVVIKPNETNNYNGVVVVMYRNF